MYVKNIKNIENIIILKVQKYLSRQRGKELEL